MHFEGLVFQGREADQIRRAVSMHGLPLFPKKSTVGHNLNYLFKQAQLSVSILRQNTFAMQAQLS